LYVTVSSFARGFTAPATPAMDNSTARPPSASNRTDCPAPKYVRARFEVFASPNPLRADDAATEVSIAFHPCADLYDVGTAETCTCVDPSDIRQYRADGVRLPASSFTRCGAGTFFPGGSFCRSAIAPPGPTGGLGT
jgi:hypothetical protein